MPPDRIATVPSSEACDGIPLNAWHGIMVVPASFPCRSTADLRRTDLCGYGWVLNHHLFHAQSPFSLHCGEGADKPAKATTGSEAMDFETVTIIIAIIGTGVALATVILTSQRDFRQSVDKQIGELRESVGELRERMARLEGLFEGFTKNPAP